MSKSIIPFVFSVDWTVCRKYYMQEGNGEAGRKF